MHPLPTRRLPEHPDLGQLKRQSKELLEAVLAGEDDAVQTVHRFHPAANLTSFALHDAQLVLARSYGYDSWPKLKAFVDGVTIHRLMEAVRQNQVEEAQTILKIRPELVTTVEAANNEHTALHHAVLGRMSEMTRMLMRAGAHPHAGISPHNEATSALTIAEERGYDEIAAILRAEEARRNAGPKPADNVLAPLRRMLQDDNEDGAIAYLEHHPELIPFKTANDQRTILHIASARLLPRLAEWLLDHRADVNAQTSDGSTPLDVMGQFTEAEPIAPMADLLRSRGAKLTTRSAVILGDTEFLRARHFEGALAIPQDDRGWLLRLAVDHDRLDLLKLLLGFGLDPDARALVYGLDEIEFTWGMPLYACVRQHRHDMAEMLLAHGADPNAQVYASGTPLSEAYGQRDEQMVALLERYGGKSNPSMAGLYQRKDLAERLLSEYGDTPLPDDGFSSGPVAEQLLGAAGRGGDPEILRMALDRVNWPRGDRRWYGPLTSPLGFWNHWIGPWCHPEWDRTTYLACFRMILERCGPPTARLRFGCTILQEIVTMGDHVKPEERVEFAEAALDAGARLDLRDDLLKSTPLGWACRWGREELVRLFLARGADPVESEAEPWATPLAWAEKKGNRPIAALLRNS